MSPEIKRPAPPPRRGAARQKADPVAAASRWELMRIYELVEQAPVCMVLFVGPEHIVRLANPAYFAFSGLTSDILGRPAREGLKRGYARGFGALLDEVYASGESKVIRGAKLSVNRRPGGPDEDAWGDFVLQPLRDERGAVFGVFLQGQEVTQEKLAADALRASSEALRAALDEAQAIFDNSHDVICLADEQGRMVQVNRQCEAMWGYRPEELIGRCTSDLIHPDDRQRTAEMGRLVRDGAPTSAFQNRILHKDGTVVPMMWSAVYSKDRGSNICIGRDMREHLAAEEKLRQAQKMEAIGRLTGGIAHDFNNLLAVVIGSTEALSETLADRPELAQLAEVALNAAERGAELVTRLLAFARNQPLAPQAVDCLAFLETLQPILGRAIGGGITIEVAREVDRLICLADPTQLASAMLNLAINARDAMPEGGVITLRAAREPAVYGRPAFAVLSVEDTGHGMSPEVRARALEPFFTTKPEGAGSGLGLSMVHGFVAQSEGQLEIASAVGHGTQVRMCLPELEGPCPAANAGERAMPAVLPRHVLLVDDDDLLREQVERQLAVMGCRVTAQRNAHDALRRLAELDDIDLLMTDIVMPGGMNGRQLADHARLLRPGLPVLFTSGHAEEANLRDVGLDERAAFLAKPYRRGELARRLAGLCANALAGAADRSSAEAIA